MRAIHASNIEVHCPHCRALLAVELRDLNYCDAVPGVSARCCECKQTIKIPESRLPSQWLNKMFGH